MSATECPHCHKFFTLMDRTACPYCFGDLLAPAPPSSMVHQESTTLRSSGNAFACPKCGSTNLTGDKKGFGLGKALVGGVLLGGVGLLGGFVGSRKITVTCMQCGHAWEAGKQ